MGRGQAVLMNFWAYTGIVLQLAAKAQRPDIQRVHSVSYDHRPHHHHHQHQHQHHHYHRYYQRQPNQLVMMRAAHN